MSLLEFIESSPDGMDIFSLNVNIAMCNNQIATLLKRRNDLEDELARRRLEEIDVDKWIDKARAHKDKCMNSYEGGDT